MAIGFPAYYRIKGLHGSQQQTVYDTLTQITQALGWKPLRELMLIETDETKEDPPFTFDLKTISSSPLTFGERIVIKIGKTELFILSECLNPAQFLDFGKNRRNVERILYLLEQEHIHLSIP